MSISVHVQLDGQDVGPDGVEPLCGYHQGPAERSVKINIYKIKMIYFLHTLFISGGGGGGVNG